MENYTDDELIKLWWDTSWRVDIPSYERTKLMHDYTFELFKLKYDKPKIQELVQPNTMV